MALSLASLLVLGGCLYGDPYGGHPYGYYPDHYSSYSYYRPSYSSRRHHDGWKHRDRDDPPRSFKPASPVGRDLGSVLGRFRR